MTKHLPDRRGFTLLEVVMSIALLGILVGGIATVYRGGLMTLDAQSEQIVLDSPLRSRMELLLAQPFDGIGAGDDTVSVGGEDYRIVWTWKYVDLDGDSTLEDDAKLITVTVDGLPNRTLQSLVVDHKGRVGKI